MIQYFIVSQTQTCTWCCRARLTRHSTTAAVCPSLGFQNDLQRLMTSSEELCRNMAFSLALRCMQNNPAYVHGTQKALYFVVALKAFI